MAARLRPVLRNESIGTRYEGSSGRKPSSFSVPDGVRAGRTVVQLPVRGSQPLGGGASTASQQTTPCVVLSDDALALESLRQVEQASQSLRSPSVVSVPQNRPPPPPPRERAASPASLAPPPQPPAASCPSIELRELERRLAEAERRAKRASQDLLAERESKRQALERASRLQDALDKASLDKASLEKSTAAEKSALQSAEPMRFVHQLGEERMRTESLVAALWSYPSGLPELRGQIDTSRLEQLVRNGAMDSVVDILLQALVGLQLQRFDELDALVRTLEVLASLDESSRRRMRENSALEIVARAMRAFRPSSSGKPGAAGLRWTMTVLEDALASRQLSETAAAEILQAAAWWRWVLPGRALAVAAMVLDLQPQLVESAESTILIKHAARFFSAMRSISYGSPTNDTFIPEDYSPGGKAEGPRRFDIGEVVAYGEVESDDVDDNLVHVDKKDDEEGEECLSRNNRLDRNEAMAAAAQTKKKGMNDRRKRMSKSHKSRSALEKRRTSRQVSSRGEQEQRLRASLVYAMAWSRAAWKWSGSADLVGLLLRALVDWLWHVIALASNRPYGAPASRRLRSCVSDALGVLWHWHQVAPARFQLPGLHPTLTEALSLARRPPNPCLSSSDPSWALCEAFLNGMEPPDSFS